MFRVLGEEFRVGRSKLGRCSLWVVGVSWDLGILAFGVLRLQDFGMWRF